jgi:hypothetical protein
LSANRSYKVVIRWKHHKFGPQFHKTTAEGTSIRRAIANALLAFFNNKDTRKQRRDAHPSIEVSAQRLPNVTASQ